MLSTRSCTTTVSWPWKLALALSGQRNAASDQLFHNSAQTGVETPALKACSLRPDAASISLIMGNISSTSSPQHSSIITKEFKKLQGAGFNHSKGLKPNNFCHRSAPYSSNAEKQTMLSTESSCTQSSISITPAQQQNYSQKQNQDKKPNRNTTKYSHIRCHCAYQRDSIKTNSAKH